MIERFAFFFQIIGNSNTKKMLWWFNHWLDEIFQLINIKLSKYLQHYFFFLGFFFWEHDDTFLWQKVGNNEIMKGTWLLRRPIRFSNLIKTSVEGTWEKTRFSNDDGMEREKQTCQSNELTVLKCLQKKPSH